MNEVNTIDYSNWLDMNLFEKRISTINSCVLDSNNANDNHLDKFYVIQL